MTLLYKIELTIDHDPAKLSKKYTGQIINFNKAREFFRHNAAEFIDSGVSAYSKVNLLVQVENGSVESFQKVIVGDFEKAFSDSAILNLVRDEYVSTQIEQELIGMYK